MKQYQKERKARMPRGRRILFLLIVLVLCSFLFRLGSESVGEAAFPKKYEELVTRYASENGLSEDFVYAVIYCESGFEPDEVSSVGARGLMQMTRSAFDWVAMRWGEEGVDRYEDIFDPELNIKYGCRMLGLLQQEYKTPTNVLCAYHAGWGITRQWLEDVRYSPDGEHIENIPYKDTAYYVDRVLRTAEIYRELYDL